MATYKDGAATLALPDARLNDSNDSDAHLRHRYPELRDIRLGTPDVWKYVNSVLCEAEKHIISASRRLQALEIYNGLQQPEVAKLSRNFQIQQYASKQAEIAWLSSTLKLLKFDLSSCITRLTTKWRSRAPYLLEMELSSVVGFAKLRARVHEWAICCSIADGFSEELPGIHFGMQMILAQLSELLEVVTQWVQHVCLRIRGSNRVSGLNPADQK